MKATGEKDSWKVRQEAILSCTTLLAKKIILNTPVVGELANTLKDRLTETNLNLRARVVQCIDALVKALDGRAAEYGPILLPELMKLTGDSKSAVVDAVYCVGVWGDG